VTPNILCQHHTIKGNQKLKQLINDEKIELANKELKNQIDYFKSIKNYDTLTAYMPFIGSYALSNKNRDFALSKSLKFVDDLKKNQNPNITTKALKELAWIYEESGKPNDAYNTLKEAIVYANQLKENSTAVIADFNYNMGYYAAAMGDYPLSKKHYFKSLELTERQTKKDYVFNQQINNALGGAMWREGKLDSSYFFFNQSLKALKNTKNEPINKYYRPSLVNMNLAVLSNMLGKNTEAISFSELAIKGFNQYINLEENEQQKNAAKKNQLVAIDNLGVFYNTIGQFNETEKIISYSYNQKKKMLEENNPDVIISKIILAQSKLNTQDLIGAAELLDHAIQTIQSSSLNQLYWHATALLTRGKIYEQNNQPEKASEYYTKAEAVFRKSLAGKYNDDFLLALNNMGLFYAKNGKKPKAVELAEETYKAVQQGDFKNTRQELTNITTIAEIYYQLNDYLKAKELSQKAINFKINSDYKTTQDSILIQFDKPRALYINASSKYHLTENKNGKLLLDLLKQIETAITILEQRKTIINTSDDIAKLMTDNFDLFNFAKQLRLNLYEKTKDKKYLNDLISIHESSIYNRIRSRLNLNDNIAFNNIPRKISERETALKNNISKSLNTSENIKSYFDANIKWRIFLDSLKLNYPKYYKMRYATIEEPLDNLQKNTPKGTTVVRYLFIEKDLYAFVINNNEKNLIKINAENLNENINKLGESPSDINSLSSLLFSLYKQLWLPIEKNIKGNKVVIIPDAELFNLSFETLITKKVNSFKDLANNCLLSKHIISYNYSLFLLDKNRKTINYNQDFIAFAPEFNDKMKNDYKIAITDSLVIDKMYLTLLPQPFSVDLAKEYSKLFSGTSFLNEKASKQLFTNEAKEHKIIHIGTHAESNNVSPELSRLIFAKNTSDEDNSLYTYEIYNQNLSSNLAILTACETGKPTYQAGEGMISLAHAFNYAGSESILTSLWKIDEQSSAKIIENFYTYIKRGLPKDEALQKAKLDYIATAQGRTIHPQYWAGLVLIGDTSPIKLTSFNNSFWWIIIVVFGITLICGLWFVVFQIKSKARYRERYKVSESIRKKF
ncbi:MAG: CHAT domain-containing protein, partial [Flaviramulus sp.]|nr:CHAT domain-containing protein [Flaviramulus sp.]